MEKYNCHKKKTTNKNIIQLSLAIIYIYKKKIHVASKLSTLFYIHKKEPEKKNKQHNKKIVFLTGSISFLKVLD